MRRNNCVLPSKNANAANEDTASFNAKDHATADGSDTGPLSHLSNG
jgi:hypothetical protein